MPGEKLRTTYEGSVVALADPRAMADPGKAFKENPHRRLKLELIHEGVGPLYGHVGQPGDGNDFARAHFEQHMRVAGTLSIDGAAATALAGHGLRATWGPRYWQSTPRTAGSRNFGDDQDGDLDRRRSRRWFHKGDELLRITAVGSTPTTSRAIRYHSGLRANVSLDGRSTGSRRVRGFIPLRNAAPPEYAHRRGHDQYLLDGKRRASASEYLDQQLRQTI